jgi:general secretion pathway protein K
MTRARERGWALISVLWTVAMLAMMAAAAQELTLTSVRTERRALVRAHLDADLDSAVVRALLALEDSRPANHWRVDGYPYAISYDGVDMTVSVQDEDGKFDLNETDGEDLLPLFESVGLDSRTASTITDRIVEWRTDPASDDAHTLHGGNDQDYVAAGRPWRPRHGEFQTVSELNLVLGVTPQLFAKVRPALTVYSRNDSPDPNLAPRLVLAALNPGNPGQVDKIMAQRSGAFTQAGLSTTKSTSGGATIAPGSDLGGRTFEIDVDATYAGRHVTRRVVLVMTGDITRPYLVEDWE